MTTVGLETGGRRYSCASSQVSLSSKASSLFMCNLLFFDPMFRVLFFSVDTTESKLLGPSFSTICSKKKRVNYKDQKYKQKETRKPTVGKFPLSPLTGLGRAGAFAETVAFRHPITSLSPGSNRLNITAKNYI